MRNSPTHQPTQQAIVVRAVGIRNHKVAVQLAKRSPEVRFPSESNNALNIVQGDLVYRYAARQYRASTQSGEFTNDEGVFATLATAPVETRFVFSGVAVTPFDSLKTIGSPALAVQKSGAHVVFNSGGRFIRIGDFVYAKRRDATTAKTGKPILVPGTELKEAHERAAERARIKAVEWEARVAAALAGDQAGMRGERDNAIAGLYGEVTWNRDWDLPNDADEMNSLRVRLRALVTRMFGEIELGQYAQPAEDDSKELDVDKHTPMHVHIAWNALMQQVVTAAAAWGDAGYFGQMLAEVQVQMARVCEFVQTWISKFWVDRCVGRSLSNSPGTSKFPDLYLHIGKTAYYVGA